MRKSWGLNTRSLSPLLPLLLIALARGAWAQDDASLRRGVAALDHGDLPAARSAFEALIREHPRDARGPYYLGVVLSRQNDRAGAERQYRAAIRLDARLAEAHNNLGVLLRDAHRVPEAIASFREAVRWGPYGEAQYNLGLALEEQGDASGAAAAYRAAAEASARDADPRNALGVLLQKQGDRAGAIRAFRDAARVAPDDPLPHVNLGLLLVEAGDTRGAACELGLALDRAGRNRPVLARIGNGYRRLGSFDRAISALERAVAIDEPTPSLLADLGLSLKGAGRVDDAIARFEEAIRRDGTYAPAHYLLGNALAGKREWSRAADAFRRFLELAPRSEQAEEASRRLEVCRRELAASRGKAPPRRRGGRQ